MRKFRFIWYNMNEWQNLEDSCNAYSRLTSFEYARSHITTYETDIVANDEEEAHDKFRLDHSYNVCEIVEVIDLGEVKDMEENMNENLVSGNYIWCEFNDVVGMNIYQLCKFVSDKYRQKYGKEIEVIELDNQAYDYTNKELPFIASTKEGTQFWFLINCTEEEAAGYMENKEVTESKKDVQVCSICGKEFEGYGNNAAPVNDGTCCDECNMNAVIPARLKLMKESFGQVERLIDSETSLTSANGEVEFSDGEVRGITTIYLYRDGPECFLNGYGHSYNNRYASTPLQYDEIDQFDESDNIFFDTDKYHITDVTGLVNKYKEYFQTEDIFINECLTDVNEAFDLLNKLED